MGTKSEPILGVIYRGRVGPGQMIAVNLDEGTYYNDKKIKDFLSRNPIYKKFSQNLIEISKKFNNLQEFNSFEGDKLRQKQYAAGISIEDLEMILHPMVEDQKEAVGSMGDDTPTAVLSDIYRPLSHFFRQNFSQVTNPPIDSLRENRVMSLNTRIGNLQNILGEDLFNKKSYLLESPVLSNAQFKKLFEVLNEEYREIDCTFNSEDSEISLKEELKRMEQSGFNAETIRNDKYPESKTV